MRTSDTWIGLSNITWASGFNHWNRGDALTIDFWNTGEKFNLTFIISLLVVMGASRHMPALKMSYLYRSDALAYRGKPMWKKVVGDNATPS